MEGVIAQLLDGQTEESPEGARVALGIAQTERTKLVGGLPKSRPVSVQRFEEGSCGRDLAVCRGDDEVDLAK